MSRRAKKKISTEGGDRLSDDPFAALDGAGLPKGPTAAPKQAAPAKKAPRKGRVEVRREKAGRGGKTVTTLKAFATHLPLAELDALAFDLKKSCACGGTLKGREIELQGDVCERAIEFLAKRGFSPVRAGG